MQSQQCQTCVEHLTGYGICRAFPDGIPPEIATGEHDHTKPFPGDQGIRYKQAPEFASIDAAK